MQIILNKEVPGTTELCGKCNYCGEKINIDEAFKNRYSDNYFCDEDCFEDLWEKNSN